MLLSGDVQSINTRGIFCVSKPWKQKMGISKLFSTAAGGGFVDEEAIVFSIEPVSDSNVSSQILRSFISRSSIILAALGFPGLNVWVAVLRTSRMRF